MQRLLSVLLFMAFYFSISICYVEAKDLKIGVVAPLTGNLATYGQEMLAAAKLAVDDINAGGGILGNKVKLLYIDDSCDPANAVAAAHRLASNEVVFVVGHFCSAASIASSKTYRDYEIVQMSPASTSPDFTERGFDNVFRVIPRTDYQGELLGEFFGRLDKKYNIAILSDGTDFADNIADAAKKIAKDKNANVRLEDKYQPNQSDYHRIALRLKGNNIKVLSLVGYREVDQLTILKQIRAVGLNTLSIINEAYNISVFTEYNFSRAKGEILMSGLPNFTKVKKAEDIVRRLQIKKIDATNFGLFTYVAVNIFASAAERAKSVKYDKIIKQFKADKGFETILGDIRFDKKGDVIGIDYNFFKLIEGRFIAMNTRPPPPPPPPN